MRDIYDKINKNLLHDFKSRISLILCFSVLYFQCTSHILPTSNKTGTIILTGADQTEKYFPLLKGKRIGLVINQTSIIGEYHIVDYLQAKNFNIKKIFAPEHGFRGDNPDGATILDGIDKKTGISIVSLYGLKKAPNAKDLSDIDIVVFDIQDVGTRFYTFLSTLKYVMEACAMNNKPLIILDRPNPNGQYIDGPVLDMKFASFVGVIPIPIVHGMTLGELARMMNGEHWLQNGLQCNLTVIPCHDYKHSMKYSLPVIPSPNLPNDLAIALYPSLCLFEGTNVSIGRGTDMQFQIYGSPFLPVSGFEFIPMSNTGSANPPFQGQVCKGIDLSYLDIDSIRRQKKINLTYLLDAYKQFRNKDKFFLPTLYFDKLAGTDSLRKMIENGNDEQTIRASWLEGLEKFRKIRSNYLLYSD